MAKCCDRCKKPIDRRDMMKIKFKWDYRQFVRDIDVAIQRRREGIEDSSYYNKRIKGTWELCNKCVEELAHFILRE